MSAGLLWPPAAADLDRRATLRDASAFALDVAERHGALVDAIGGRRLLVIGGAGTIGSATIRAALAYRPACVHVVDVSEANLVELIRSLRGSREGLPAGVDFRALPLDVGGRACARLLAEQPPYDAVLHFAALKHVRSEKDLVSTLAMLDVNVVAHRAFLARLADHGHDARYFAVSSDKAADPSSVMGASKRLMEDLIFARPARSGAITTSARFANVAFSNGSLLDGFLHRLASRQPLSVPERARRTFLSRSEAGELCLLAAFATPDAHLAMPRPHPDLQARPLIEVAEAFLQRAGLRAEAFDDEGAARAAVAHLASRGRWPLLITPLDTSGEKEEEIFVGAGERVVEIGLRRVQGLPHVVGPAAQAGVFDALERLVTQAEVAVDKADLIELLRLGITGFAHVDTGVTLDLRP